MRRHANRVQMDGQPSVRTRTQRAQARDIQFRGGDRIHVRHARSRQGRRLGGDLRRRDGLLSRPC